MPGIFTSSIKNNTKYTAMSNRKVILSMQMTLDGYVAGPNDELDWLISSDDEWTEMFKDLESVDTFLLGRKMYPGYAGFWLSALNDPSMSADLVKFARLADKTQHIVFTRSDFKPEWKNTKVSHDPAEEIARLKKQDGKDIMAWGGASFARELIRLGLVDEYRISLNPTLIGDGKSLFSDLKKRYKLQLVDSRKLSSGVMVLRYR
jgi:dihydrofolate reductase